MVICNYCPFCCHISRIRSQGFMHSVRIFWLSGQLLNNSDVMITDSKTCYSDRLFKTLIPHSVICQFLSYYRHNTYLVGTLGDFFLPWWHTLCSLHNKGLNGSHCVQAKNTQQTHFFYSWTDVSGHSHINYSLSDLFWGGVACLDRVPTRALISTNDLTTCFTRPTSELRLVPLRRQTNPSYLS